MRVKVIINPAAGLAEPVLPVLNDVFGPAGIEWDVAVTHRGGDGLAAAREAVEQGFDVIGVYGGDGTIAEVATALADGGPPMLVLPGGTGNALANELGIPPVLAEAAALAMEDASEVRLIDLGQVGERRFVLRLTMGFETALLGAATREMKDRYGWLAYALAGVQTLADPPFARYSVVIDGVAFETEGLAAVVANSASIGVGGAMLVENADICDGILDFIVLQNANLPSLLASVADVAQGQEPRGLLRWRGKDIRVVATPRQSILIDGEEAGRTPVEVRVSPQALGVLVPKKTAGEPG